MPLPTRNKKGITPAQQAELERLRYEVKRKDDKGLHDTVHHYHLRQLESELGLIPAKKDLRAQTNEVTNGEPDL